MYDSIIIGGGPAGLTAGIYLARAGLKTLIIEKETIGGGMASAPVLENYPGLPDVSGSDIASNMFDQAESFGVEFEFENVIKIHNGDIKKVITEDNEYETKTIIIATGSKYRTLGLEDEDKYIGNGVHFCVSCDGAFYKNKNVGVVGGGNTAITNALYLADLGAKVYIIHVLDHLNCEELLAKKIKEKQNVEIMFETSVEKYNGEKSLESITIKNNDEERDLELDGLFISIGMDAETELIEDLIEKTKDNYIINKECETTIPGIFVAGDCRDKTIRQVTTATSDGTIAASLVIKYLQ